MKSNRFNLFTATTLSLAEMVRARDVLTSLIDAHAEKQWEAMVRARDVLTSLIDAHAEKQWEAMFHEFTDWHGDRLRVEPRNTCAGAILYFRRGAEPERRFDVDQPEIPKVIAALQAIHDHFASKEAQ